MKTEADTMRLIQIEASSKGFRLFRNNVGTGWVGNTTHIKKPTLFKLMPGDVVIRKARPLHAGLCEGSSDLIGFSPSGMFTACEIKTPEGSLSQSQSLFIDAVNKSNGIAGCCRSIEDFNEKFII